MSARTRSISGFTVKGTAYKSSTNSWIGGSYEILTSLEKCDDIVAPSDCGLLTVEKWKSVGGVINGSGAGETFYNYLADAISTPNNWPHIVIPDVPLDSNAALMAVARTSPNKPYVDLPVMLLELGDVVQLIRDSGRHIYKKFAGANIKVQFGILPLVSDLVKLLNLQDQINRRIKVMLKLQGPLGYRRTVDIGRWSGKSSKTLTYQSNFTLFSQVALTGTTTVAMRAHVRWGIPIRLDHVMTSDAMSALAKKAVLGLTLDASTAWEALPWSWLIDWGFNVSAFLQANRNIIPATLLGVHIMKHTQTVWISDGGRVTSGKSLSQHKFTRETKSRRQSTATPVAHFPFLSGKQVGIVASLSVLRAR